MLKSVIFGTTIVLLVSCSIEPSFDVAHEVKIPPLPAELSFSLPPKCKLEPVEITVFGDDKQKIRFKYKLCSKEKLNFSISNYRRIMMHHRSFIVIDKLKHHTPKSYMEAMAKNAHPDHCFAVKTPENLWLLISPIRKERTNFLHHYSKTNCGRYEGFSEPRGWVFAIKEEIVFGFKQENVKNFIDLDSITFIEYR